MLLRVCVIALSLSLVSAAAVLRDQATSVSGAEKRRPAKAVASPVGQQRRAAAKKPAGKAQGQGLQFRHPARKPARQQPSRRPLSTQFPQIPDNMLGINGNQGAVATMDPRQPPMYLVCYLYPVRSPVYQGTGPSQPFAATSNGAMYPPYPIYPPYGSYKSSLPAYMRESTYDVAGNKIFGPQLRFPNPSNPIKVVCPLNQPVNADATVSPMLVSDYDGDDSDYWMGTDDPDFVVEDADPARLRLPDEEEIPFPYKNVYGSSWIVPESMYPSTTYVAPQAFWYPPTFPFRAYI